jgi:hypothetical protein
MLEKPRWICLHVPKITFRIERHTQARLNTKSRKKVCYCMNPCRQRVDIPRPNEL